MREKLRRPAESRTTDLGMVTRAVATHRTMSTAEGGLLSCMGVPAPGALVHKHEPYFQARNAPTTATLSSFLNADTHSWAAKLSLGNMSTFLTLIHTNKLLRLLCQSCESCTVMYMAHWPGLTDTIIDILVSAQYCSWLWESANNKKISCSSSVILLITDGTKLTSNCHQGVYGD